MNKMCRTNTQEGRSMIEMLGVLAIIGVLSVGGIAGYSKAMMKFKINKTIDQITQISQNIRILYARQKSYKNLSGKVIRKANLAPSELFLGSGSDYTMTNAWGGPFYVVGGRFGLKTFDDGKDFTIYLNSLPEEACIELMTHDWGSDANSGLVAVGSYKISGDESFLGCQGSIGNKIACPGGSEVSVPMPVDVAVDMCSNYSDNIMWKFY